MSQSTPDGAPGESGALLDELVARCVLALEEGDRGAIDRIKVEHPELAGVLAERLAWLDGSGLLPPEDGESMLESFGHYRVIERVGRGGMGAVYRALQTEPVRREVALKVLKPGLDSREVVARFAAEHQTLARISHEHVARIYDAGLTPGGRPFFAMEFVAGQPITDYCDAQRLSMEDRLRLFASVCNAVQHAHQNGIIHRDLKPSNILVVERGDRHVPKIIDFGIAKSVGDTATGPALTTAQGHMLGTPEYMSPEQALGDGAVDTRTDVFSLGAVLYELLTGTLPFDSARLRRAGIAELHRILVDETPATPSTRMTELGAQAHQIAERRGTEPAHLRRRLRGDLDRIAMTAMDKDRERRYGTPAELAADVRRFLAHEPISAAPPGLGYRLRKLARRHRLAVSSALAALALLVVGTAGTTWGLVRARHNLQQANANLEKAHTNLGLARSAVDRLLTRMAMADLEDTPRTHELRRRLLVDALEFHRAFLAENPGDPATRRAAGAAAVDLGKVLRRLGRFPEAERAYAEADELLRAVIDTTGDRDARLELGILHTDRLEMHAFAKRGEAGAATFATAAELLEGLERETPDDVRVLRALAYLHQCHAMLLDETGGDPAAAADLQIEYRARVADLTPEDAGAAVDLGVAQHNRAIAHLRAGETDATAALLEPALAALDRAVAAAPEDSYAREMLANTLITTAQIRRIQERIEEGIPLSRRALVLLDELIADFPDRPDYRYRYGLAVWSLIVTNRTDLDEALDLLRRARDELRHALGQNPDSAIYKVLLERVEGQLKSR